MDDSTPTTPWQRRTRPAFQSKEPSPEAAEDLAEQRNEDLPSVIGKGIRVIGKIEADVDLRIEGRVEGDVVCATLLLGEEASVTGSVYADRVLVAGIVEGGIDTTDLAIEAGARVSGDITFSRLRVSNGGIIAGKITHISVEDRPPKPPTLTLVDRKPATKPKKGR